MHTTYLPVSCESVFSCLIAVPKIVIVRVGLGLSTTSNWKKKIDFAVFSSSTTAF